MLFVAAASFGVTIVVALAFVAYMDIRHWNGAVIRELKRKGW